MRKRRQYKNFGHAECSIIQKEQLRRENAKLRKENEILRNELKYADMRDRNKSGYLARKDATIERLTFALLRMLEQRSKAFIKSAVTLPQGIKFERNTSGLN